jgi:eukaryotic-like serine/threonine-protein kinase
MSLAAGERIGRYEILAPLGAGGMGEVYSARDPHLDRRVAVKILTASRGATRLQLDRFQREARAIARITHPHICTIHDVGQVDGVPFLVMELLEGTTLAERLESGPLPLDRALAIAGQIAAALDAAHRKDVIHRDLKPSNVMLTAGGVKLLDFGLAKLREAEAVHPRDRSTMSLGSTQDGTVLGTVPYMAPEQVEAREIDARTDIFALGVILYEMASGQPPFQGRSTASLMAAILTHDPQPLSSLRPIVPASLDRVVRKCLAKDPDERWQSAADLAAALQWSGDDSSSFGAPHAINKRRYLRRSVLAATGMVAIIGALAVWMFGDRAGSGNASATTPQFIPVTFRTGTISAARFASDGDTVVYSAAWGGDQYELFVTRRGTPESRPLNISDAKLLGVSSTGDLAFLRGSHDAVRLLAPPRTGVLARVAMTGGGPREILGDVVAADWAPGGELAVVRRDRVEFPLGKTIHGRNNFAYVRVAPDGQRLAVANQQEIAVLDRAGNKTVLSSASGDLVSVAWSPSGDEVWFAAQPRANAVSPWTVRAVSLAGEERVVFYSAGTALAILDVSRDGRALVATHDGRMGCSCLPPGQGQLRELSWLDGSAPEALSADGQTLLLSELLTGAGKTGSTYIRKTDGSDAIRLGDGYGEDLSPDGKWVLTTEVRTRQHWILLPTGPGSPKTLPSGPLVGRNEANFLPDGRRIVFGGSEKDRRPRIYLQDIDTGSIRAISPEGVGTGALATPDSRYVIGWTGGRLFKYAIDEGPPVPLTFLNSEDRPVQWSRDGSLLYVWRTDAWPPVVDRVTTATGERRVWKTMQPSDLVGIDSVIRILVTPDGQSYCHDYVRLLSRLFIVEGLK